MTNPNPTYKEINVRGLSHPFLNGLKKDRPFELKEIPSGVQVTLACKLHLGLYHGGTAGLRGKARLLEKHADSIEAELASDRDLRESIAQLMKTTPAESDATEMSSAAIVDEGPPDVGDHIIVGGDEAGVSGSEYWTPMVFAMVAANGAQKRRLEAEPRLIRDSKALSQVERVEAAKRVMEICPDWAVRVISPAEYNDRAPKTAWYDFHIDAYLDCLRQLRVQPGADVHVDRFDCGAKRAARIAKEAAHHFRAKLTMIKGGESECKVIAAASCIASAIRDSTVPRLREELKLLGAGRFDPAAAFKERSHEGFAKSEVRKFYEERFGRGFLRERARVEKPLAP